jgi:hypothetical protein
MNDGYEKDGRPRRERSSGSNGTNRWASPRRQTHAEAPRRDREESRRDAMGKEEKASKVRTA